MSKTEVVNAEAELVMRRAEVEVLRARYWALREALEWIEHAEISRIVRANPGEKSEARSIASRALEADDQARGK